MNYAYLTATLKVTTESGDPLAATWVTLKTTIPSGEKTDSSGDLTNPDTGEYQAIIPAGEKGTYLFEWEVSAPGNAGELHDLTASRYKV